MTSNNVGHLITSTIITLQHFASLHHTLPNYTLLHLSTLHFLSFTLHYSPIWLNPSTFPIVLFRLTQYVSHIPKLISKVMNPFTLNLTPMFRKVTEEQSVQINSHLLVEFSIILKDKLLIFQKRSCIVYHEIFSKFSRLA